MGHVGRSDCITLLYHYHTELGWTKKPVFYLSDRTFSAVLLFMLPVVQNYHLGSYNCISVGSDTRDRKGALILDHKIRKTKSHSPDTDYFLK